MFLAWLVVYNSSLMNRDKGHPDNSQNKYISQCVINATSHALHNLLQIEFLLNFLAFQFVLEKLNEIFKSFSNITDIQSNINVSSM